MQDVQLNLNFKINDKWFFSGTMSHAVVETYDKKRFVVSLKFTLNWVSCILSDSPRSHQALFLAMGDTATDEAKPLTSGSLRASEGDRQQTNRLAKGRMLGGTMAGYSF